MGVMLQAFYWDCPTAENREHEWWVYINSKLPAIADAGFTALWLPPANKAASWKSMGYDPYDYYDLGEFDQKGGVPTWFGSKAELLDLIQSSHAAGLQVYADLVFNHNSGGDAQEPNPIDGQLRWTKFAPKSNKFPVTGNVSIRASTRPGTAPLSAICRTYVIERRQYIQNSSTMPAGFWKKSASMVSVTTWSRVTAVGWYAQYRNCAHYETALVSSHTL